MKDEIRFLPSQVPLYQALLIHARYAVIASQRGDEIFENPLGRTGKPIELLLGLQVPVEEVAGVGLRPVAIPRSPRVAVGLQVGQPDLGRAFARGHLAQYRLRILRVASRLAVGAPLDVDEPLDAFSLRQQTLLVFTIVSAVPASPDGGRIYIWNVPGKVATAE